MIRPRTALLAALALACGSALAAPKTLKDAYRDDFLLGTAVNDAIVSCEDAAQQALAAEARARPAAPAPITTTS